MATQLRQANYTDYTSDYNELQFVIRQRLADIQTALPVKIVAVKDGFVDVKPIVQQLSADGSVIDHGVIYNIPYFRLQGGVNGIIIDPAVGDIGLCVFCSRDISGVKNARKNAPPSSRRMHSFSDGVYIGGILNDAPTRKIVFDDSGIDVNPSGLFKYDGIEVATVNDVKAVDDRAKAAESNLNSDVEQERKRASNAEYVLQENLKLETNRAMAAEAAELARALAAEAYLQSEIDAEIARATAAEAVLTANLNAEINRATNAENTLTVNLNAEITRATNSENVLSISINDEKTRAQGAEASLSAAISTLGGEVSAGGAALSGEITAETNRAQAAESALAATDADLQTQITAVLGKIIGYNQDWKDKMSMRDANVTYTNNTDRPIMVNLALGNTPSTRYFIEVNGVAVAQTSTEVLQNISFIVQIGGTYKYANPSVSSSNGEIRIWSELTSSTT